LRTLARTCFRHRDIVLVAWLLALALVAGPLLVVGAGYSDSLTLPDTESTTAFQKLRTASPALSGDSITAVAAVDRGRITDPGPAARFAEALKAADDLPQVASVTSPFDPAGAQQVSADGKIGFATVRFSGLVPNDVTTEQAYEVRDLLAARGGDGVDIEVTGQAAAPQPESGPAELIGLAAAAVVLFLVFGSLLAMTLPLITAILSVAVAVCGVGLLANVLTVATFSPLLSVLLGLGVGVDYALFIVTRYRQGLLEGLSPEEAVVESVDTSGRAVLFAGITVCIALLGLFALGLSFLYGVAIAASLAVATTVVAALTLLPALLGFFGTKVLPKRDRARIGRPEDPVARATGWARWAGILDRRPAVAAGLATLLVLLIAVPFLSLRLGVVDQGSDPADSTTRKGYDLLARGFGPGFNGPLLLVTDLGRDTSPAPSARLVDALRQDPDVAAVTPTTFLGSPTPGLAVPGGIGVTTVYPRSEPQSEATSDLLARTRDRLVPQATAGSGQDVYVGGSTAAFEDFSSVIAGKLPLFVGVVVALSFLLLMVVFRSLLVPAVAAVMNLLSAGAAFGVVVAVFQWGWLAGLFGIDRTGPILSFLPVILFAILFGLSMDYEVFLLSRIHEEWLRRRDNREAVVVGLAATGRTITAAAAIMFMLFMAFVLGDDLTIKLFGLGLAAAVLVDALVIRSVLVPGLMLLLGRSNWYLPAGLERTLPHLSVEGAPRDEAPSVPAV